MASEKATALVIRVVDFSETSAVVTLFTREFGKVGALAKGARRPKGPFESALDLASLCRVVFLRKSSGALDLLTEAKLERRFRGRERDLSSYYAGYYVAELLNDLTDDYDAHEELFDLAEQTLLGLMTVPGVAAQVLRFELLALRILGHMPSLVECVECGQTVPQQPRVPFSRMLGGVLCPRCRPRKSQVISLSQSALGWMRAVSEAPSSASTWPVLERPVAGELRGVMNHYISHVLGHQPRLHRYLDHVS